MKPETDDVNTPEHYIGEIECIDAMVQCFGIEQVQIYSKLAAFKYLWRSEYKHKDGGKQDLAKAGWYLRFTNGDDPRKTNRV